MPANPTAIQGSRISMPLPEGNQGLGAISSSTVFIGSSPKRKPMPREFSM